jgi:hypothetical protein
MLIIAYFIAHQFFEALLPCIFLRLLSLSWVWHYLGTFDGYTAFDENELAWHYDPLSSFRDEKTTCGEYTTWA